MTRPRTTKVRCQVCGATFLTTANNAPRAVTRPDCRRCYGGRMDCQHYKIQIICPCDRIAIAAALRAGLESYGIKPKHFRVTAFKGPKVK